MSCPLIPMDGWVVVKPFPEVEEKTSSGLILDTMSPAEKDKRKNRGVVVATPADSPVSEGCTVYFKTYAGQDVYVPGEMEKYLLIENQDLVCVLKKKE